MITGTAKSSAQPVTKMANSNVHLNGKIVPAAAAVVSVSDAGFLHGASAFTTMLARNGVVFRFDRHIKRLFDTVRLLDLRTDATPEGLKAATYDLLKANELTSARGRITLTPGDIHGGEPTTLITAQVLPDYPREWYTKGIGVVVSSHKQVPGDVTCGHKTGCYLPRVLARQEAAAKGAEEALWFTTGNCLAEGCFTNVFLVLKGVVLTPPIDTPALPGVVREAVIELCRHDGIACDDGRNLTVHDMLDAEEMFLTASCSGIRPVARVERHAVGDESPGAVTKRIMAAYESLLEAECSAGRG
jgi:branched-chain amino acid aminotransferase